MIDIAAAHSYGNVNFRNTTFQHYVLKYKNRKTIKFHRYKSYHRVDALEAFEKRNEKKMR